MSYLIIYFFAIFITYGIIFHKLIFPLFQTHILVLLNNAEIRWGGWFITHHIFIKTFLWIPYMVKNIDFKDINAYYQESFEPFKTKLSEHLSFRDSNYSLFLEENYKLMQYFIKKSLNINVDNIIQCNLCAIESIIPNITLKIKNHRINKHNFFIELTHLVWNPSLWKFERKNILLYLGGFYAGIIFLIPFYIYIIFFRISQQIFLRNIVILNKKYKDIPKQPYIWIEENNLIGRKGNRFMNNKTEYIFYVENIQKWIILWKWMIRIHKSYFGSHSFPISGTYKWLLNIRHSQHFSLAEKQKYYQLSDRQSLYHEIPFSFSLPKKSHIKILKQIGVTNETLFIHFETKLFKYLPETNLLNKNYHYHSQNLEFIKYFHLKFDIKNDNSTVRFQYRRITKPWEIVIWFNKELKNIEKCFTIKYKSQTIKIEKIFTQWFNNNEIHILYNPSDIEIYDFKKHEYATIECQNLEDIFGNRFYTQKQIFSLPWDEKYKKSK